MPKRILRWAIIALFFALLCWFAMVLGHARKNALRKAREYPVNPKYSGVELRWLNTSNILIVSGQDRTLAVQDLNLISGSVRRNDVLTDLLNSSECSDSVLGMRWSISPDLKSAAFVDCYPASDRLRIFRTSATMPELIYESSQLKTFYYICWFPNSHDWLVSEHSRTNATAIWSRGNAPTRTGLLPTQGGAPLGIKSNILLIANSPRQSDERTVWLRQVELNESLLPISSWRVRLPVSAWAEMIKLSPSGSRILWKLRALDTTGFRTSPTFPFIQGWSRQWSSSATLWISDLAGAEFRYVGWLDRNDSEADFQWSPDERRVATIIGNRVFLIPAPPVK